MKLPAPLRRTFLGCALASALAGCAVIPPAAPDRLFHDAWFQPVAVPDVAHILALDDDMRRYAQVQFDSAARRRDARGALLEALGRQGDLRLAYDATRTGTAAETFRTRRGNCLSLALMTAAFARHLGVQATFREVQLAPEYERVAGLMLQNGHVNLLLGRSEARPLWGDADLVVDFLPGVDLRGQRATPLAESTVLAMFMNNRAAETLAEGRVDESYAWARAAVRQDTAFAPAANTLAVVYLRRGRPEAAEAALRHALAREPDNTAALSNLAQVLAQGDRTAEAQAVRARLTRLQPEPPFHFLELGRAALEAGDAARATALFARELGRQPYQHEVHYWAAQAWLRQGDGRRASEHLRAAMDYSPTLARQRQYGAKLDHLRAQSLQ